MFCVISFIVMSFIIIQKFCKPEQMEKLHVNNTEWNTCKFSFSVSSYWYPPILYTVERFFIGNVVHKYEAHGATIVRCCDGAVPFLSSSVLWRSIIPLFDRQITWGSQSLTALLTYSHSLHSLIQVPLISNHYCII